MIPHLPDEIWLQIIYYSAYDAVFPTLRSVSNLSWVIPEMDHEELAAFEDYLRRTGKTSMMVEMDPDENDLKELGNLGEPWRLDSPREVFADWFDRPPFVNHTTLGIVDKTYIPMKALIQKKMTDFFPSASSGCGLER